MKKSAIFVLLLVAAMILGVTAAASAASKADHWANINSALDELGAAIDQGNSKAANKALENVRTAVYNALKYLASINEYSAEVFKIIEIAQGAMNQGNSKILTEAYAINNAVFDSSGSGPQTMFIIHS